MLRSVLVTRPQPAADELAARLLRAGMIAYVAPLMRYADVPADLGAVRSCDAIVFTSVQGAYVFSRQTDFRELPVFAVGEATAQAARKAGFTRVYTAAGDGRALAALISSRRVSLGLRVIFYASGENIAADLGAELARDDIEVIRAAIYKAELIDDFPPAVRQDIIDGKINTVTLFSARTARNFARIMTSREFKNVIMQIEVVCLSANIAREINEFAWYNIRIARTPHMQSMMDILREKPGTGIRKVLLSDRVIAQYGGLRPLASRLNIPASTVQGWKERGVIPDSRAREVIAAMTADRMNIESCWKETTMPETDKNNTAPAAAPSPVTPRDHQTEKRLRIAAEKKKFFNRTVISVSVFSILFIYAAIFLLTPELTRFSNEAAGVRAREEQMKKLQQRLQYPPERETSLGGIIHQRIGQASETVSGLTQTARSLADTARNIVGAPSTYTEYVPETIPSVQQLLRVLSNLSQISTSAQGRAALADSMTRIRGILDTAGDDTHAINSGLDKLRRDDPVVARIVGHVDTNDLAAAALLLTLNEFRGDVSSGRSFEKDLEIIARFTGDDPDMQQALMRLAPYAKSGVLSRATLQKEFKNIASDIVMAKLHGEDVKAGDRIKQRLAQLVRVRKTGDITGDTTESVVARAQIMLDNGNVRGAIQELQKLDGENAAAAAPFIQQAQGNIVAEDSSAFILQFLMSHLSNPAGFSIESLTSRVNDLGNSIGTAVGDDNALPLPQGGFSPYISPTPHKGLKP